MSLDWGARLKRVARQPIGDVVVIKLLAPEHARQGLAMNSPSVVIIDFRFESPVKLVGFPLTLTMQIVEAKERAGYFNVRQSKFHHAGAARRENFLVPTRHFSSLASWVNG